MNNKSQEKLIKMVDGSYVEHDVLNIVEKVRAYDPNLRVKYTADASFNDAPFIITELCKDGVERLVMNIWELNETVLERLYDADNAKRNVLADLENFNATLEKEEKRRYREEMDEAKDIVTHIFGSRKGRYSFIDPISGRKITIDDQEGIPAKVERPKDAR